MANITVGTLNSQAYSKPHSVHVAFLDKTDGAPMVRLINDVLRKLDSSRAQILLTGTAVRSGRDLQLFFLGLPHVTCFEHGLRLVCQFGHGALQ